MQLLLISILRLNIAKKLGELKVQIALYPEIHHYRARYAQFTVAKRGPIEDPF